MRSFVRSFCCWLCLVIVASEVKVVVLHNSYVVLLSSYQGSRVVRGRRKAEISVTFVCCFWRIRPLFVSFRFREASVCGGGFDQRFARFP